MNILIIESDNGWRRRFLGLFADGNAVVAVSTLDQGRGAFTTFNTMRRELDLIIVDGYIDNGWTDAETLIRDFRGSGYAGAIVGLYDGPGWHDVLSRAGCDAVCLRHQVAETVERLQERRQMTET